MFRLLRLVIFTLLAFAAGVMFERNQAAEQCAQGSGEMRRGHCIGASE
ncbi:hypothetical protein EDD52_101612 [Primorskyibacter sedentarius]|uniref:Uncharacterized protein n=1 Tax=Primorskyibacter sedentarius TaxID=745311 RepID=A0A4V2UPV5_9RHOB|nr:hypothetical protein EDD52_101612 [Primorskyibacter sedentarius]